MIKAYLDGELIDLQQASISVHDAGLQHGVGLFETMRSFDGRIWLLDAHVDRLISSAQSLGLSRSLRHDPLCEAVEYTLKANGMTDARIRLTVTGGDLSLLPGRNGRQSHQPSVLIIATEPTVYPDALFEQGVMVNLADAKANPFDPMAGHKTLNYWARLQSLSQAAALGAGESLWFSVTNHLVGGAVSNAIVIKGDYLLTPIARDEEAAGTLPSATRPGITRGAVLQLAESMGLEVRKQMLSIDDVLEADELFLTNSSWLMLPVVAVEKRQIADGQVGPLTRQLRQGLLDQIRSSDSD